MRRGELTVFFAMVFILIVALLSSLVEVSRRQGVRMQVVTATDAACESVFAEYDTKCFFMTVLMGQMTVLKIIF